MSATTKISNTQAIWTTPYYGVSHLKIPSSKGFQFTLIDYSTFVKATVLPLFNQPWINFTEEIFDTVADAQVWLLQQQAVKP